MALLYASKALDEVKAKTKIFDQQIGVQVLQNALRVPLKTIASNAGGQTAFCGRVNGAANAICLADPEHLSNLLPWWWPCVYPALKAPGVTVRWMLEAFLWLHA